MTASAPEQYWDRRAHVQGRAAGPGAQPVDIDYTAEEDETWATVIGSLVPLWERHAATTALSGLDRLHLDRRRVPQLREVTARLAAFSGFRYEAVPGLVPKEQFFGALAERRFLSTQYVRWSGTPDYTPEPDVIHEVIGHAHLLAHRDLAELHELAGSAMRRLGDPRSRQFVADVFWFSGEFGVVRDHGSWKAYGAGLLSSIGELASFARHAHVEPLDVVAMGTTRYNIDHYQPVLFGATSVLHVLEVVGGFFARCTDDLVARLTARSSHR